MGENFVFVFEMRRFLFEYLYSFVCVNFINDISLLKLILLTLKLMEPIFIQI